MLEVTIFKDIKEKEEAMKDMKKKISEIKIVVNGAGASAQACANLFKSSGVKKILR